MGLIKTINTKIEQRRATVLNSTSKKDIRYLVSNQNWSIHHDGECLMQNLPALTGELTISQKGITHGILHYGGIADALNRGKMRWPDSNQVHCGLTWFHILENDKRLQLVNALDKRLAFWHSSCQSTMDRLIRAGADPRKCHVIPLGVDPNKFQPATTEQRNQLRTQLGISEHAKVIGSFQKDGKGWNTGRQPKLEKGPDILCDVAEGLAKNHEVFVILSGPARGYVKQRLEKSNIPYFHTGYLNHANDVAPFFAALDVYLISSRIEGGPKAALEAPASGVPLVSTAVGMVPDIITHGINGLINEVEDVRGLIESCEKVFNSSDLANKLCFSGRQLAESLSWQIIAQRYCNELYLPLLKNT